MIERIDLIIARRGNQKMISKTTIVSNRIFNILTKSSGRDEKEEALGKTKHLCKQEK